MRKTAGLPIHIPALVLEAVWEGRKNVGGGVSGSRFESPLVTYLLYTCYVPYRTRLIIHTLARQSGALHEDMYKVPSTEPGILEVLVALPLVLLPGIPGLPYQLEVHI